MRSPYSIIIPIHNEINVINDLLNGLIPYSTSGHEVIIVDDGSSDGSEVVLAKNNFVKSIILKKNQGKGEAIKKGLLQAFNDKIIIFDGDLELDPKNINRLMILNRNENTYCVFGTRFKLISPFKSKWDLGNYIFTWLFNFIHKTDLQDALCCAKAFYKKDINPLSLVSSKFDIDIELASLLVKKVKNITSIKIDYNRRTKNEGKKLQVFDSFSIFKRMIKFF